MLFQLDIVRGAQHGKLNDTSLKTNRRLFPHSKRRRDSLDSGNQSSVFFSLVWLFLAFSHLWPRLGIWKTSFLFVSDIWNPTLPLCDGRVVKAANSSEWSSIELCNLLGVLRANVSESEQCAQNGGLCLSRSYLTSLEKVIWSLYFFNRLLWTRGDFPVSAWVNEIGWFVRFYLFSIRFEQKLLVSVYIENGSAYERRERFLRWGFRVAVGTTWHCRTARDGQRW